MSYIDWEACEERPGKNQKVEGRVLLDLREKINDLEKALREKSISLEKSEKILNEKVDELNHFKAELNQKDEHIKSLQHQIDANNLSIEDLESELSNFSVEIKTLEKDLDSKINENMDLKRKCENLERKKALPDKVEKLINRLKAVMQHKGFISEKEFEDIITDKNIYEFT